MNLSLYDVASEYLEALDFLSAQDEMPAQAIADTLEGLAGDISKKAVNVAAYFRNLDAEIDAVRHAEKLMNERRLRLELQSQRLKDYLLKNMERCAIKEVKCPYFVIKVVKNPPKVVIDQAALVPAEFVKEEVIRKIDALAIKKALQAHKEVPGASLVQFNRLSIK